jgi:hypothetical protein
MLGGRTVGTYLNPGIKQFAEAAGFRYYVDKSGIIAELNKVVETPSKYVCVSRPRRFGKTITANMLSAYYGRGADSAALFDGLAVAADPSFGKHLNKYNVIFLNMAEFLIENKTVQGMAGAIKSELASEFADAYPGVRTQRGDSFSKRLNTVFQATGIGNVVIIDEWDCVFREKKNDAAAQREYLDFLRLFLKDQPYVSLAYMTGILPIKKYGSHSALGMFDEFSMTSPKQFDRFIGFTAEEVQALCRAHGMDFAEMSAWYDGYRFPNAPSVFNPRSVVAALSSKSYDSYWTRTETYEALKVYIDMDFDGLRESVVRLLAGDRVVVNTGRFTNDMVTFQKKDDVLTLMVHLGYLGYLGESGEAFIPNKEISGEYVNAIESPRWGASWRPSRRRRACWRPKEHACVIEESQL